MKLQNAVYRFINKDGEIIYIGKAKRLRSRLNSHTHLPQECYEERERIEFCTFETEDEMDLAERYFIPKIKPKYNDTYSGRTINFNIDTLDNIQWYVYGTKKEIEAQVQALTLAKAKEQRRIELEGKVGTLPQEIESLKSEIKIQSETYLHQLRLCKSVTDTEMIAIDEKIDELREMLQQKRELLFEWVVGEHSDNVKHGQLMLENDVFSLEELFEKDVKNLVNDMVTECSDNIDKKGWYDVELLTYKVVNKYHFHKESYLNLNRDSYLLDMSLKGLENGLGTAHEVVERVLKEVEEVIQLKYGEMVQETIIIESEDYSIWKFGYKIPQSKLIKRPILND